MTLELVHDRDLGELVDDLDPLAADVEDAEERRARVRDRERRAERGEHEHGQREDEPAPRQHRPRRRPIRASTAGTRSGAVRHVELAPEGDEGALELGHLLPPPARKRASARAVRDFTVPRRTPSTTAVSSSESSRK